MSHKEDEKKRKKIGIFARLRRSFFTGILITVPIALTLYLTWWAVNVVDGWVAALLPAQFNPQTYLPISIPGIGLVIAVVVLIIIGAVGANVIVRLSMRVMENFLNRIPAVRAIYATIKQVLETVFSDHSGAFRTVVVVEYPRKDMWVMGFATGEPPPQLSRQIGKDLVNVFIPTTPNPTSGFLFFVPREDVIWMPLSTDEGVKLIFSAGITPVPDRPENIAQGSLSFPDMQRADAPNSDKPEG